jgi:lysophospholipase L1-like esterase
MGKKKKRSATKLWPFVGLGILAVLTLTVVGFALMKDYPQPSASPSTRSAPASPKVTKAAPAPAPKIDLSPGTKTIIFGDSWTAGYTANPLSKGYAFTTIAALQLDGAVNGGPGTGYLNPGQAGTTFSQRFATLPADTDLDLLIIQGSVNDQNSDKATLGAVVDKLIADAKAKFPNADIVILGPAPSDAPANPGIIQLDDIIGTRAKLASVHYISPLAEKWITEENEKQVIDQQTQHPSNEGHDYLSAKLVDHLRKLAV